jgi:hypothetical protein
MQSEVELSANNYSSSECLSFIHVHNSTQFYTHRVTAEQDCKFIDKIINND